MGNNNSNPIDFTLDFNKKNFDCMIMEIIRLRENAKTLYKEISHYQNLYIQELESKRTPVFTHLTVTKGGNFNKQGITEVQKGCSYGK